MAHAVRFAGYVDVCSYAERGGNKASTGEAECRSLDSGLRRDAEAQAQQ